MKYSWFGILVLAACFLCAPAFAFDSCILTASDFKVHAAEVYGDENGSVNVDITFDVKDQDACDSCSVLGLAFSIDYDEDVVTWMGYTDVWQPNTFCWGYPQGGPHESLLCLISDTWPYDNCEPGTDQLGLTLQFDIDGEWPAWSGLEFFNGDTCGEDDTCFDDGWIRINRP